jgi:ATP-dependent Clp protease ATP-binding subunit ClpB
MPIDEHLTLKMQEAVQPAQNRGDTVHAQLEPEHLLGALIAQEEGIVAPMLRKLGAAPEVLRAAELAFSQDQTVTMET